MQRNWKRQALCAAFLSVIALPISAGCGGAEPKRPRTVRVLPKPKPKPAAEPTLPPGVPAVLPASLVATLEGESALPLFARRGPDTLLMYAEKGRWKTRLLKPGQGSQQPEPTDAGEASGDIHIAAVRAVQSGYLAAWIEPVEKNSALKMMALDASGKPISAPVLVRQSADEMSWIEILPNSKGALLLWETNRDRGVDLDNLVVIDGKTIGNPQPVFRRALQWQAVPFEEGAAVAAVEAPAPKAGDTDEDADPVEKTGRVLFSMLDMQGHAKTPVVVHPQPTAFADIELVYLANRFVVAFTDRALSQGPESRVMLAALSKQGALLSPPHGASPPLGDQALVALIAPQYAPMYEASERALLAWEDTMAVQMGDRRIRLAAVDPDGGMGKERASMVFAASGPPDFAVFKDGFAALTLAAAQSKQETANAGEPDVLPAFVRFGSDLSVLSSEPVRALVFGENAPKPYVPYLVRGLSCYAGECSAFAQDAGTPAALVQVALPVRENIWKAPALNESNEAPPQALSATSIFSGDGLNKIASVPLSSGGTMLSYLTYHLEDTNGNASEDAPKKGEKDGDALATLGLIPLPAKGEAPKPLILSKRAVSLGGLAMAQAPKVEGEKNKGAEIALAWVAKEKKGDAQVFVTKVNEAGEKQAQRKVTVLSRKAKGDVPSECSDVAIAYVPSQSDEKDNKKADGFVLAWVDTRDGNAEVYVAKVDRGLNKTVPDRRITQAPGDAAEVQLWVRGKEIWLLWSDARQNAQEGRGDIYLARLDAQTLSKIGQETRLYASAGHSRTPMFFANTKQSAWAAWIEEGMPAGKEGAEEGKDAGLRMAELDERGALLGTPLLVQARGSKPVDSAALSCEGSVCRAIFSSAPSDTPLISAFSWTLGKALGTPKPVAALPGGASQQDISPIFSNSTGNSLFLIDNAVDGTGKIRQLLLNW